MNRKLLATALACTIACYGVGAGAAKSVGGVKIEQAAIPAEYESSLPTSVAVMQAWMKGEAKRAPTTHVVEHILFGSRRWLERLRLAGSEVKAKEALDWARQWNTLFEYEEVNQRFCREARSMMSGPASGACPVSGRLRASPCRSYQVSNP